MCAKKKSNVKKYLPILKVINKLNADDLNALIDILDDDCVDTICECIYNVIYNSDLNLSSKKKRELKKVIKNNCSVDQLKVVTNKRQAISKRRKALKSQARGIPMLLASAIPFLINLFTGK